MTEELNGPTSDTPASEQKQEHQPREPRKAGKLSPKRVLIPGVIAAGLAVLVVVGAGLGWEQDVARLLEPPVVPVTGRVLYNGEPLAGAQITTRPSFWWKLPGATAISDDEGRFALETDVGGRYVEGAYACEHQVAVAVMGATIPGAGPSIRTPKEYAGLSTTPLTIEVRRNSDDGIELELAGDPLPEPAPPPDMSGMKPPGMQQDPRQEKPASTPKAKRPATGDDGVKKRDGKSETE